MIITDEKDTEMSKLLEDPITGGVLEIFENICSVPHWSGNEKELVKKIRNRAEQLGYAVSTDKAGNLLVSIPASPGSEDAPVLMFQGHLDMVCAVAGASDYDPSTDPVTLVSARDEEDGSLIIRSDRRSSLGADCGMGDAAVMWLFDKDRHDEWEHGPVKVFFTVDEEEGLVGARTADLSVLDDVSYLVNVDGFTGGRLIAGSAGGRREIFRKSCNIIRTREIVGYNISNTYSFELCFRNFSGGHSGFDIDRGRLNAAGLMCELLISFRDAGADFALSSFRSGTAHNVIPSSAEAVISIRRSDLMTFQKCVADMAGRLSSEDVQDDGIFTYYEIRVPENAFDRESRDALLGFVDEVRNGVVSYMDEFDDIVDTSCNLGRVNASVRDEGPTYVLTFERSMNSADHDEVVKENKAAADRYGFEPEVESEYDAWKYDGENPLLAMAREAYADATGEEAEPYAVHIGIEPSIFYGYKPELTMISAGTTLHDPHTIYERCETESIKPLVLTLRGIAGRIAKL